MPDEAARLAAHVASGSTPGFTPRWTLGGETALALRLGHRISDDIEIFLSGVALAELTPARNARAIAALSRAIDREPQWPGHSLKFTLPEGEVDFLASALQTSPGFTVEMFRGRPVALETVDEVIVKKVRYLRGRFTPRDAFDLACAAQANPEVIVAMAREVPDALPRLGVALDVLNIQILNIQKNGAARVRAQVRATSGFAATIAKALTEAVRAQEAAMRLAADPPSKPRSRTSLIKDILDQEHP